MKATPCRIVFLIAGVAIAAAAAAPAAENVRLTVRADRPGPVVNPNIYGHFAEHLGRCIYEGLWVGEDSPIPNTRGIRNDVVAALKEIKVPVLRWPGGCFADEYHWRDGIGPREQRPKMINTHWGGVVENNHFGTHEFLDLCGQLGAEPYICGNVGSGSVREMMEWVEYMTSDADSPMANLRRKNGRSEPWRIRYFGVGNESWGCGGNMRPEFYADQYRRYNTFIKNYPGNEIYRIACGANAANYDWTEVLMREAGTKMNGLSLHYYTVTTGNWGNKGSATEFDEAAWHATLRRTLTMDELVARHAEIMDRYDRKKRVGMIVDEWGTWHNVEPGTNPGFLFQQNTLRDALAAALNFHIFHKHADRVAMANIAQTVNVLQAMVLTDKERMLRTPTYHVFEMFKVHQGGTFLPVELQTPDYALGDEKMPAVSASATRDAAGRIHLSLVNTHPRQPIAVHGTLSGAEVSAAKGRVLTAAELNAHNTFDRPDAVKPETLADLDASGSLLTVALPPASVAIVELQPVAANR